MVEGKYQGFTQLGRGGGLTEEKFPPKNLN